MNIFNIVFLKILSSIFVVLLGYVAGKIRKIDKETITSLLFYFIAPIVIISILTKSRLKISDFSIVFITFLICSCLNIITFFLSKNIWNDNHKNILAFSAGTGNGTFVALPIATALFDTHTVSIYVLIALGVAIYEISVGYYVCALTKERKNFQENLFRIVKLPIFISFVLGSALSLVGFRIPEFLSEFTKNMQSCFSVLGMLLVGVSISEVKQFKLDWKFLLAIIFCKFVLFTSFFNLFVFFDKYIFKLYNKKYHDALQLISVTPISVSVVITSIIFNLYPEKASTALLFSLLVSLIYSPLVLKFLLF
ncbi:MAG: AEC family transporter [Rickettsia sp.]|nr:AEC family transporter [Rickettsia sp.]